MRASVSAVVLLLSAGPASLSQAQIAWTETTVDGSFDVARGVFSADVDGDGDLDVLGASFNGDDIAWWENTAGDGSAWTKRTVDGAFNGARGVFSADVDGDGDLDVLGAAQLAHDIAWWENTAGDGSTWTEHTVDASFDGARSVFAADVDGDGDLDVLGAADTADDIAWWENTAGDGSTWTEHTVDGSFDEARSVFAADVDGDGDLDVVGAAATADDIAWWENTAGDGTAWTEHTVDASFNGAQSVFAADVDGDGDLDILGAAGVAGDVAWWENTAGDGSAWTERTVDGSFGLAGSVSSVDMDGDGDLDVLAVALSDDDIAWWENTAGNGTAWTEHTVDASFDGAVSVVAADVDGDGDLDVVGAGENADAIAWWENSQRGRSTSTGTSTIVDLAFTGVRGVFAGDVDGDGDLDVVGAASTADDIAWWENTAGNGTAWSERTVDDSFDGARNVFGADVDGDGDLDILGAASTADEISWWENTAGDGTAWTERAIDTFFDSARSVFAADVDGDGDLDVLGAAKIHDDITWWENTAGNGTSWTEHTVDGSFDGANSVFAADVDGDGDVDVLGAAETADDIAWWENTAGDGSAWTERTVDASFDGAFSVYSADVDGDGDMDVLGAADVADDIAWWENTAGDGTAWTEHTVDATFDGAHSVSSADMDMDGDLDILGVAATGDDISWWENTAGDGSAWTEHTVVGDFDAVRIAVSADVDGDGDLDVLGAASNAHTISWWANDTAIRNQGFVISGTAGTGNNVGWRLLSAPCASQTRSGMSGISISGDDEIRRYDESAGSDDARWLSTASSGELAQGTGFAAYLYDDATQEVGVDFGVAFNACTPTTSDVTVSTLDVDEEWFLGGNPFMQSFDLSSLSGTGFQTTYKLWNPSTSSYTDVTASGGTDDVVPVGQGLFVQRTTVGAGGTSVTYGTAGKTSGGTLVGKTDSEDFGWIAINLRVVDPDGNELAYDEAAKILVAADATLGWDRYESSKLRPLVDQWATVGLIGDRSGSAEAMSLLSLPSDLWQRVEIPLQIDAAGVSGRATLSWPELIGIPEDWSLELIDLATGFSQDVRRVQSYTFPLHGQAGAAEPLGKLKLEAQAASRFSLVVTPASATGLDTSDLPADFELAQNYPNPFNPETVIRFALPEAAHVRLTVFDMLGREVATLAGGVQSAGWHEVQFSVRNLSSGVYLYRLTTPTTELTQTMQLVR